jgi:hypothetical protein
MYNKFKSWTKELSGGFTEVYNKVSKGKSRVFSFMLFIILGLGSLLWFLIRVIPKPSRATYPCVRATAPWASAFAIYLLGITTSVFSVKKFGQNLRISKFPVALLFLILAAVSAFVTIPFNPSTAISAMYNGSIPNQPIGQAKGIFPGRVVWVHDADATDASCTNTAGDYWFENTDLATVESMLAKGIKQLAGNNDPKQAWNKIFVYFNENHEKGSVGYQPGEKIYIKINLTTSCCGDWSNQTQKTSWLDHMDATPQLCLALLRQLINEVGVAQSDIYLGDPFRKFHDVYWNMLHPEFPDVHYMDGNGDNGREQTTPTSEPILKFSDRINHARIPQEYVNAAYFINMPCLKTHNEGAITLAAKNHQGSILADGDIPTGQSAQYMHYSLPANNQGNGKYRHTVDYMGHEQLGGKTLLYLVDGIWAGRNWEGIVEKWQMAPFNNDYPSSLFLSQDPVAVEAVCFDFLLEEYKNKPAGQQYPYISGVDDYLYQAADSAYWPAGINYDPEGDGTILPSLGVYEHWNDPVNKQYTRNLKTGNGIELMLVEGDQIILSSTIDTANSELPNNMVNTIYVDSSNVKWIGTNQGLARYDDSTWTIYAKNDTLSNGDVVLLSSNIKDIAYERTGYGTELWMATDSGLTVAAYKTVDGITSATTYHKGNSGLLRDTVSNVAVDVLHNRWIATDTAISIFKGNKWDTLFILKDVDHIDFAVKDYAITDIQPYDIDSQAYISTAGRGVARVNYNTVDGFTGASGYGQPWSKISSNYVQAIAVKDEIQWYGTIAGASKHTTNLAKEGWTKYELDSGLVDTNVVALHIDENNNIWLGTTHGLSVLAGSDIYKYTENEGLISNIINHITSDMKGNVWIATPAGIEWFSGIPGLIMLKAPVLISPVNDATGIPINIALNWQSVSGATGYTLQVDTLLAFENPWLTVENIESASHSLTDLKYEHQYFWRIAATRTGEIGPWSDIWNFTTQVYISDIPDILKGIRNLTAYPNPVHDYLYLQGQCTQAQNIRVRIYAVSGQLTDSPVDFYVDKNTFNIMIDVSDQAKYARGVYVLQVTGETFEQKLKISIQ